jgi:tetratricopeptide (TPR) repeat protein
MSNFSADRLDTLIDTLKRKTGRRWTIREIAREVDISPGYLTLLKKGQRSKPSMDVIMKLSQFFSVAPEQFFEGEGGPQLHATPLDGGLEPAPVRTDEEGQARQTLQVCENLVANGSYRQALDLLAMILGAAAPSPLKKEARFLKARALLGLRQYDDAMSMVESYLDPENRSIDRAQALSIRGRMKVQTDRIEEAIRDFLEALELVAHAEASNEHDRVEELLYRIHFTLGVCYMERGEYGASIYHWEMANRWFPVSYSVNTRAHLLMGMGNTYLRLQNWQAAERAYEQSEELFRELGDPKFLADIKHNMARIDMLNSRYPEALEKFKACMQAHQSAGDHLGIGNDLYEMALCDKELAGWEQVSELALRAMVTFENGNVLRMAAKAKLLLTEARLQLGGTPEQALVSIGEVKAVFEELSLHTELSKVLRLQAEICQRMGDHEEALKLSMQAYDLYVAHNKSAEQ